MLLHLLLDPSLSVAIRVGLEVTFLSFDLIRLRRRLHLFLVYFINIDYYIRFHVVHYLIMLQRAHLVVWFVLCDAERSVMPANDYLVDCDVYYVYGTDNKSVCSKDEAISSDTLSSGL